MDKTEKVGSGVDKTVFWVVELIKNFSCEGIMIKGFSHKTIEALGYYVYVYSDPDTRRPFYVGKGKGNRVFNHMDDQSENEKVRKINDIKARGKEPNIEILAHGLDEETAFKVEAAAIDLIGIENLTNRQRGHESSVYGKIEVSTLDARYSHEELNPNDVTDNIMFIRINKLYRNDMTPLELYEATRGYWKVNIEQARKVDYVLSVYDGMVLEAYAPAEWLPAKATFMERKDSRDAEGVADRYEFVGRIADVPVRKKYVDKSVSLFFPPGNANPIKYVWGKK